METCSELLMSVLCCGSGISELQNAVPAIGFKHISCNIDEFSEAFAQHREATCVVVCAPGPEEASACAFVFEHLQSVAHKMLFNICLSHEISSEPYLRMELFAKGARMITSDMSAVRSVLHTLAEQEKSRLGDDIGVLSCAHCGMDGLTENNLHRHLSLYHSTEPNIEAPCPLCSKAPGSDAGGLYVHFHNCHGPLEARDFDRPPFGAVVRVVCMNAAGQFLLVHEPAGLARGLPRFWYPAGFLNKGESFLAAAIRETKEEGGVDIKIIGILSLILTTGRSGSPPCPRVVLLAQPSNPDSSPKSIPDFESVGATWAGVDVLARLKPDNFRMRGFAEIFPLVHSGVLVPQSLDTPAFLSFDKLVQRLTASSGPPTSGDCEEFMDCWDRLKTDYPAEVFQPI